MCECVAIMGFSLTVCVKWQGYTTAVDYTSRKMGQCFPFH